MHALNVSSHTLNPDSLEDALAEGVARIGGRIESAGPKRWKVTLARETRARATIALHEDWLTMALPLTGLRFTRITHARRQGMLALDPRIALPSGVRPVLSAEDSGGWMRGDRPVANCPGEDSHNLARWIGDALTSSASFPIRGDQQPGTEGNDESADSQDADTKLDIPALCARAGWAVTPRNGHRDAVVELPGRGNASPRAVVSPDGDGLRARVTLEAIAGNALSPPCLAAVSLALLLTAGSVRLVRTTATRHDEGISAAFEVRLDPPLGLQPLEHALCALAVAHQQTASELVLLAGDEPLARAYLGMRGIR